MEGLTDSETERERGLERKSEEDEKRGREIEEEILVGIIKANFLWKPWVLFHGTPSKKLQGFPVNV